MPTLLHHYKRLNKPVLLTRLPADLLTAIPRIVCGVLLAKDFGADKFGMPWSPEHLNLGLFEVAYWFPADVASYGGPFELFPEFFAWMGAFAEAVGGLFLALGFNTRMFAFLIACTMLVAIFCQKWDQGVWGMLPAMGFLWVSVYALVLGSGRFGVDYVIDRKLK